MQLLLRFAVVDPGQVFLHGGRTAAKVFPGQQRNLSERKRERVVSNTAACHCSVWHFSPAISNCSSCPSLQLPASRIWELLLLAEVFGARRVFQQCRSKVLQFLVPEGGTVRKLPASIMSHVAPEYCNEVQDRLASHFMRFGNSQEPISPHNAKRDPPSDNYINNSPATSTASEQSLRSASTPAYILSSAHATREDISDSRSIASWATDEDTVHEQQPTRHAWPGGQTAVPAPFERQAPLQPAPAVVPIPVPAPPPTPLPSSTPPGYAVQASARDRASALQPSPSSSRPRRSASPTLAFGSRQARSVSPALSRSVASVEEPVRKVVSTEELQLSREVALLRVREAKIQKELQESRAQAEAALRENKLRSLKLKTDILRLGTSIQQSRSPSATTPRRSTPSRMLREEVEEEANRVESARLAAMRRIAEQRQKEKYRAEQMQHEKEEEAHKQFQKRDAKVVAVVLLFPSLSASSH